MAEQDGIDTNGQFYYADGKKLAIIFRSDR
jgi:hypothetical protein